LWLPRPRRDPHLALAPLVLLPLLWSWSYNRWCFSGMEVPLVALFVTLACVLTALPPKELAAAPLLASATGVLLALTRADGVLLWGALFVVAVLMAAARERRLPVRLALTWLAPLVLGGVPHTLWRVSYIGARFSN